ncbi:DUF5005 domain-containing protein [Niabella aquatica]
MKRVPLSIIISGLLLTSCQKDVFKNYKSPQRAILFFTVENQIGKTVISRTVDSSVVVVTVPYTTDLTAIKPVITVSDGATITPASGKTVDFSGDKTHMYTVTSQDGQKREWEVRIQVNEVPLPWLVPIPNEGKWDANVKVYSDTLYNNYLTRYSGWNGADGCYSTLLPNGSLLWTFQDSFFGEVTPERARINNTFVRNTGILQEGMSVESFIQLNPGSGNQSQTWIKYDGAAEDQDWYWPGAGQVYNNELQVLLGHVRKTGDGAWDFAHTSTDVAIFDLPSMQMREIIKDKDVTNNYDAGSMQAPDGYTYMYATENGFLTSFMYVARVAGNDLKGTWEYYGEKGWSTTPSKYNVCSDITQPNVFYQDGKYYLVSQQIIFGQDIYILESDSPVGPWTNKRTLYRIPEKYDGKDIITYNAFVHHALSRQGELVISYNINPTDFWSNFNNPGSADRYRPYFVRVFNWK